MPTLLASLTTNTHFFAVQTIMSVPNDSPGIKARANVLASDALATQLSILQVFLPLDGWLVGQQEGGSDEYTSLAASGIFTDVSADLVTQLLSSTGNQDPTDCKFGHRLINDAERQSLAAQSFDGIHGKYLLHAGLSASDGSTIGRIVGLAYELPLSSLTLRAYEIRLCLSALALTVALHAELDQAEQLVVEMQRDAFIDPLTKVLNRAGWMHRLSQIEAVANKSGTDAAIVILDLDFLKQVNDSRGHSAGDDLLRRTAQTISSVLRTSDSVGRFGGDEFGVVVQNATPAVAGALRRRLDHALTQVSIEASIGMALKSEAGNLKETVRLADQRMYAEKRNKSGPQRQAPAPRTWPLPLAGGKN